MNDLGRFAELGKEGVLALLSESTNAERPGYTMTERKVADSFENLFLKAENKRIIVASFASNINRIQQIIHCAQRHGRKVAFSGRSMLNYVSIANELGYMDVPESVIIDIDLINRYVKRPPCFIYACAKYDVFPLLQFPFQRRASKFHQILFMAPIINQPRHISQNPSDGNSRPDSGHTDKCRKQIGKQYPHSQGNHGQHHGHAGAFYGAVKTIE